MVELLIVVAIIAILAVVVFVALNPLERFQDSRDSTRSSDVTAIIEAIRLYQVDNGGTHLTAIDDLTDETYYMIGTCSGSTACGAQTVDATACADLGGLTSGTPAYLPSVPTDPSTGTDSETDYYIWHDEDADTINIGACDPENTTSIEVQR